MVSVIESEYVCRMGSYPPALVLGWSPILDEATGGSAWILWGGTGGGFELPSLGSAFGRPDSFPGFRDLYPLPFRMELRTGV